MEDFFKQYKDKATAIIHKQYYEQLKQIKEEDKMRAGIDAAKKLFIEQLVNLNNEILKENEKEYKITEKDIEEINFNFVAIAETIPFTNKTKKMVDELEKQREERIKKVAENIDEVKMHLSFIKDPKRIEEILTTYHFLENGKVSFDNI